MAINLLKHPYQLAAEELKKNPEQWTVYNSDGHCVILAGPGSGKTKTLTIKLAKMLAEEISSPHGFACITYNTECAREIAKRLKDLGVQPDERIFIGTVHSFCLTQIVQPFAQVAGLQLPLPPRIAQRKDEKDILQQVLRQAGYDLSELENWKFRIDNYRKRYPDRAIEEWEQDDPDLAQLVVAYETNMHKRGLIDFDDMVVNGLYLLNEYDWIRKCVSAKFPVVAIDEYQDLGVALHQIVLALKNSGSRLLAVGDPDQSVYGFNEAKPKLLRELAKDQSVQAVQLRFNYRNGKNILSASLAALGEHRDYVPVNDSDGVIYFKECKGGLLDQANTACALIKTILDKGAAKCPGDIALIYRSKFDGDIMGGACTAQLIKFIRFDSNAAYPKLPLTRFLEDCAVWCSQEWSPSGIAASDLIAVWLGFNRQLESQLQRRMAQEEFLDFLFSWKGKKDASLSAWLADFDQLLAQPFFANDPSMHDQLEVLAKLIAASNKDPLRTFSIARFAGQADAPDHVRLITFHSAKGLEFDAVIMLGLDEGSMPSYRSTTADKLREDRQLFYVGLTRARHEIHLLYSGFTETKSGYRRQNGRSRFVTEVEKRLQRDGDAKR